MKSKILFLVLGLSALATHSAFAGSTNVNFAFGGPDKTLGTSQAYASSGATITTYGYECSAPSPSSTSTLSNCSSANLFAKDNGPNETGLGLVGQGGGENEIGWDGPNADFVIGTDVSSLFKLGATSITLSFGSVQPGDAFAILGYASDPFLNSSFALTNTKAFVGNDGSTNAQVFSTTIGLSADDQFLVFVAPCAASLNPPPCGSNTLLDSLSATSPTPEPGTMLLFGSGLVLVGLGMRRRFASHSA